MGRISQGARRPRTYLRYYHLLIRSTQFSKNSTLVFNDIRLLIIRWRIRTSIVHNPYVAEVEQMDIGISRFEAFYGHFAENALRVFDVS